jgi:hypothetical protein
MNVPMQAAGINWRPLGELFIETGLITRDELEEALSEQTETRQRLGQILVSHGLVSKPELLRVLLDQLGQELEREGAPGPLAHDLARRRAARKPDLETVLDPDREPAAGDDSPSDDPAAAARSSFESAFLNERAELEKTLNDQRAALREALCSTELPTRTDAPAAEAEHDPEPAPAPASAPAPAEAREQGTPVDVTLLLRQAEELRDKLSREAEAHEAELAGSTRRLQERVAVLEAALEDERTQHRRAADGLDRARGEARREASELRAAVNRLRLELAQVDAATAWFEYWSGAAQPPPT